MTAEVFGKSHSIRRSLKTRDHRTAIKRAMQVELEFDQKVSAIKASLHSATKPTIRTIDNELLDEIRVEQRSWIEERYTDLFLNAEMSDSGLALFEDKKRQLEENAERMRELLTTPRVRADDLDLIDPHDTVKSIIRSKAIGASKKSEVAQLLLAVKQGMYEGYARAFEIVQGDRLPSKALEKQPTENPVELYSKPAITNLKLSQAIDNHLEYREFPRRTQTEFRSAQRQFVELHGDLELRAITLNHVRELIKFMGSRVIGKKSEAAVERRISPDTVKKSIRLLGAAVNHAIAIGDFGGKNHFNSKLVSSLVPAQDRALMPVKRRFKVSELNNIFSHPWFSGCQSSKRRNQAGDFRLDDMYFWVPIVALFTGCRASEIGGLKVDEVKFGKREPHPHFDITPNEFRNIKMDKQRFVPIHPQLVEMGFLRYLQKVKGEGSGRVFPDWKPKNERSGQIDKSDAGWANGRVIKAFNEELLPAVLGLKRGGKRQSVTFHSFRGAYKNMLQLASHGIPSRVVNEVCGHSLDGMDKHYIGSVALSETYSLIAKTSYPNLELPAPPL